MLENKKKMLNIEELENVTGGTTLNLDELNEYNTNESEFNGNEQGVAQQNRSSYASYSNEGTIKKAPRGIT